MNLPHYRTTYPRAWASLLEFLDLRENWGYGVLKLYDADSAVRIVRPCDLLEFFREHDIYIWTNPAWASKELKRETRTFWLEIEWPGNRLSQYASTMYPTHREAEDAGFETGFVYLEKHVFA